jgi:hypothetical protein
LRTADVRHTFISRERENTLPRLPELQLVLLQQQLFPPQFGRAEPRFRASAYRRQPKFSRSMIAVDVMWGGSVVSWR